MKTIFNLLCLIALSGLLISCGQKTNAKTNEKPEDTRIPQLQITSIKTDTLAYALTLPGNLKPYEQVKLYAKIDGFVTDLKVDRGDHVKKGQLLMRIEAPEIQQQLLAAKAKKREVIEKMQFSRQNYQRIAEAAVVEGAVSITELQQAHTAYLADSATYQAVKAEVAAAKQLAQYTKITAPFDGVITRRFVSPGALVGGGQKPLVQLKQEDKLRLEVAVPAEHVKGLQPGTKAFFKVNAYPGKKFPANLSRSSRSFNPDLRSMMIEFDVDNSKKLLNGGAYAQVTLHLERSQPSLMVPQSSVMTTNSKVYIAKVVAGKIQLTPVITGLSHNHQVEVYGKVQSGDQIVVKGNSTLKEGMQIEAELVKL